MDGTTPGFQDDDVSVESCGPAPGRRSNRSIVFAAGPSGLFSSFNPWSATSLQPQLDSVEELSAGEQRAQPQQPDLFSSFNPWSAPSQAPDVELFAGGQLAPPQPQSSQHDLFSSFNPFSSTLFGGIQDAADKAFQQQQPDADQDAWINMAETLPEAIRKKESGMDVRMMHEEELEELYVKIGTRLQEAKESSQVHSGQVDGDYVIRTVTVWELNFWEASEISIARKGGLEAEYIHKYLNDFHARDHLDHPDHCHSENTPLRSLLKGTPFQATPGIDYNSDEHDGNSMSGKSLTRSVMSDGVVTLQDPTSEIAIHAHGMEDGNDGLVHMDASVNPFGHMPIAHMQTLEERIEAVRLLLSTFFTGILSSY